MIFKILLAIIILLGTFILFFGLRQGAPQFEIALGLTLIVLLFIFNQRSKPTESEFQDLLSEWLPKWEADNIKLSEIKNVKDKKAREKYVDKLKRDSGGLDIELNKRRLKRPISYYIQVPNKVDLGLVDSVFGVFIAVFLSNTIFKINANLPIQLLILILLALLISSITLGAIAVKGKELFFVIAIMIVLGLVQLIKAVQPDVYSENSLGFLVFSIVFWYITREITQFITTKLPQK